MIPTLDNIPLIPQGDYSPVVRERINRLIREADRLFSIGYIRERCQQVLIPFLEGKQPSPYAEWGAQLSVNREFRFALSLTLSYKSTMDEIVQWAKGCIGEYLLVEIREERARWIEEFARIKFASRWYQMKDDEVAWRVFSRNIPYGEEGREEEIRLFFATLDRICILTDILHGHASEYGLEVDYSKLQQEERIEHVRNVGRPKKAGRKILKSFIYRAFDDEETNLRLQSLYHGLLQLQWIAADTKQKSFMSIFSGEDTTCRVTWTGDINTLAELFKELVTRKGFVKLPESESIWVMVNARFWEKEGNQEFGNDRLRSTSTPTASKETIGWLVKLMDPDMPLESLREAMQTQR